MLSVIVCLCMPVQESQGRPRTTLYRGYREAGRKAAHSAELLFIALRAAQQHAERWEDLQKWAEGVLKHEAQAEQQGLAWRQPKDFGKGGKEFDKLELYDQWCSQGIKSKAALDRLLEGMSISEKLAELRRQIEMRTVGLGWTQFATKWTFFSDERGHTLELLRRMLIEDILPHEMAQRRLKKLPKEAPPPQLTSRVVKALGTDDADALALEARSIFNVDNLLPKALAARALREAKGISDSVEASQPLVAPAFDANLVGKRLEVCWPYKGKDGETVKIWASGRVVRVADGLTDKRSKRARMILPAGALLWAWDADPEYNEKAGEQWLILLPEKWNKQVQYAWRFDPCQLSARARMPKPSRPHIEPLSDE